MTYHATSVEVLDVCGEPIVGNIVFVNVSYEVSDKEPQPGDYLEGSGWWQGKKLYFRSVFFRDREDRIQFGVEPRTTIQVPSEVIQKIQQQKELQ